MSPSAAVYGLSGETPSPDEKAFFRDAEPWGFILFARNLDRPKQIARLCGDLRDLLGRDAPILIDQEGGRVQRLKPPTWRAAPAAAVFGALWDREPELALEAVEVNHAMIAAELIALGIDVDCAPVLDLAVKGADPIIGDRAFHADPQAVAAMGRAALKGLKAQGVGGVVKHIPGHGRADGDSHDVLPRIEADLETLHETDFAAFKGLSDAPMAMTAHVVYPALDPDAPATLSRDLIDQVIRGAIGFDGLLITDDLSMKALSGPLGRRGEAAIRAGCDMLLHCNGDRAEMVDLAHAAPRLEGRAAERAEAALAARGARARLDAIEAQERLEALFREAGLEPPKQDGALS